MTAGGRLDWTLKASAGILLGFALAVGLAGLFARLAPEGSGKFMMVMWLTAALWLCGLSAVFLFRDGVRAWSWLGGASAVIHALLFLLSRPFG